MSSESQRTKATRRKAPSLASQQAVDMCPSQKVAPRPPDDVAPGSLESAEHQALVRQLEEQIRAVSGLRTRDVAMLLAEVLANIQVWHRPDNAASALSMAIATLAELRPRTFIEAMLAVQMVAAFQASTHLLASGIAAGQSLDLAEWKTRTATNLMRLFTEQLDALSSLKGKRGRQRVVVRHVHVGAGGQAVVGVVTAPRRHRRALPGGGA